jgi:tetratricopeptide (TPR) repeat protein
VASRGRSPSPVYFEALREAAARLPQGLIRLADPASPAEIAAAEQALARKLPHGFAELLRSFNGVDLFGGSVAVLGVGRAPFGSLLEANQPPLAGELVIAETSEGDLVSLETGSESEPRLHRIRPDAEERWLLGSNLTRWLEATIAREEILYDREGEFRLEAFEPDGEVTAATALKQAERAARKDPDSAFNQYELGLAYRRLGRSDRAAQAFARAADLDPTNPWPWFDLGRIQHAQAEHAEAAASFQQAAQHATDPAGARFLAWAVRCLFEKNDRTAADDLRTEALRRHPTLTAELKRAAESDEADGDPQELADLLSGEVPLRRRLSVVSSTKPRRP